MKNVMPEILLLTRKDLAMISARRSSSTETTPELIATPSRVIPERSISDKLIDARQ